MDLFNRKKVKELEAALVKANSELLLEKNNYQSARKELSTAILELNHLKSIPVKKLLIQPSLSQEPKPDKTLVDFAIELKMRGRKKPFCEVGGMHFYYLIPVSRIEQIINSNK